MIKVLLVDDEFLVCSFLRQLINWEELGFQIVDQAHNGHHALEKIRQHRPHLLFLDVNMPEMDGIQLIRRLYVEEPELKIIMLSSYSDYDYVREAMKLGGQDYLLKHELNAEVLKKVLSGIQFAKDSTTGSSVLPESYLLRDSRTRSFFEGRTSRVPGRVSNLSCPIPVVANLKVSFSISAAEHSDRQESYLIKKLLDTCVEVSCRRHDAVVIYLEDKRLLFLFAAKAGEAEERHGLRVDRAMGVVRDALLKYHNTYMEWHRGNRCDDILMLPKEYQRMSSLPVLDHRRPINPRRISIEQERKMVLAVLGKDREALVALLEQILSSPVNMTLLPEELELLSGDLLSLTVRLYQENEIMLKEIEFDQGLGSDIAQIKAYFSHILLELIENLDSRAGFSKVILSVIDFVERHYRKDIGLSDLAQHCDMNASYLSTLFKRETGIGLAQYISRVRVYAAGKQLLMEGTSPTQVYEQVGFRNYNNFFNQFKEITGVSPKQFRKESGIEWVKHFHPLQSVT